jgi:hypothetical protein
LLWCAHPGAGLKSTVPSMADSAITRALMATHLQNLL